MQGSLGTFGGLRLVERNEKAPTIFGTYIPLEPGTSRVQLLLLLHLSDALPDVGAACAIAAWAVSCVIALSAAVQQLLLLMLLCRRGAGSGGLSSVYGPVVPASSKPNVASEGGGPLQRPPKRRFPSHPQKDERRMES